ncbi:DctP family TRAP transporter solute-binding subunit [Halocella sp. SP3-1]|uniref:DctP family TRAP transporter solute-binding subunit n=1 Tax=Halocella sp. SP3-1 TaxID=2382161 RepID=UPI000F7599C9|nr:DctP family TRAP transporter solute-binding subunit [Halocella sp. SP3-1]AZO93765.1 DctP family TRAP transporter solute-binding subunit [Halocella sp. SP3-1]
MKKISIVLFISLLAVAMIGGNVLAKDLNPSPENPVTLRIGAGDAQEDLAVGLEYTIIKLFESMVETNTSGAIQVEIFPGGQLGSLMSMLEAVQGGQLEAMSGTGVITSIYPEWQVFSIPYLFQNSDIAMSVMNESDFMADIYEDMREETGVRVLGVAQNGFRHFTNNERVIKTPEDLKGLKFRVMQGQIYQKVVEAAGGTATPIAWSELYTALQTGVVDGQENPISAIKLGSLDEVQKYITLDGHLWSENFLVINDEFFNSLPKKYQVEILNAGKEAALAGTASEHIASYVNGVNYVTEKGMSIYRPTPAELELFKAKTQPSVIEWLSSEIGSDVVEGMLDTVEKYEKKLGYK